MVQRDLPSLQRCSPCSPAGRWRGCLGGGAVNPEVRQAAHRLATVAVRGAQDCGFGAGHYNPPGSVGGSRWRSGCRRRGPRCSNPRIGTRCFRWWPGREVLDKSHLPEGTCGLHQPRPAAHPGHLLHQEVGRRRVLHVLHGLTAVASKVDDPERRRPGADPTEEVLLQLQQQENLWVLTCLCGPSRCVCRAVTEECPWCPSVSSSCSSALPGPR